LCEAPNAANANQADFASSRIEQQSTGNDKMLLMSFCVAEFEVHKFLVMLACKV
jgi:hypothetical protein